MGIDRLDRISDAVVAAALDSSQWQNALETVADATESHGAIVAPINGRLPLLPRTRSMEPSFERYIGDGWVMRDEFYRAVPMILNRGVGTSFDFTTAEEMARHPFHQDFLARFDLRWWAGVKFACEEDHWCLSLLRSPAQGPFTGEEQVQLVDLSRRLSAAGALTRALGFARADAAMAAFEASGAAILLLNRHAQVIRSNDAAQRSLGHGVQIANRRLTSFDHDATSNLDRALHQLLWRTSSVALMPPVRLPRRDRRPLLAYLLRLDAVTVNALAPCQAVVVLADLEGRVAAPEGDLRAIFGLTKAEARLAALIATGKALDDSADALDVSTETARSQLKRVFAKTDTERQAELVALLTRFRNGTTAPQR